VDGFFVKLRGDGGFVDVLGEGFFGEGGGTVILSKWFGLGVAEAALVFLELVVVLSQREVLLRVFLIVTHRKLYD
jgi:hypothetical protein